MVKIGISDSTIVIGGDEKELKMIQKSQTYDDNSACYSRGGYDIRKLKHVPLLKEMKGKLVGFAGLAREVLMFCVSNKIQIENIEDKRSHFDYQKKEYTHDELRSFFNPKFKYVEHQIRALEAMLKTNKGLVVAPTSAGKTSIIAAFLKITDLPVLILTDRATLGAQLADDFCNMGIDCGFCSGKGYKKGKCVVSTIQSVKKIQDLPRFKAVIVDECHRASSKSFQNFLATFGCPLKYGFSASPSNGNYLDFAKIRQQLGAIIIQIHSEELMENEVMAKAKIFMVETECSETEDYPSANELGIVENERRNKTIVDIVNKHKDDGGVAILIKNLEHGEKLAEAIPEAEFIRGETSLDDRMDIIKRFNEGEIKVLIGSGILNEGISISNMKVLIMAGGGKAMTQTVQKIGRVLRITENKKQGIFYDFIDMGNKFLFKHSKQRLVIYKKEGFSDITLLNDELQEK